MLRTRAQAYEVSEAYAKRQEKEEKFNAAKDERIRKNRKNEWTVVWQGGLRSRLFSGKYRARLPRLYRIAIPYK